jgi:hypothetical protein
VLHRRYVFPKGPKKHFLASKFLGKSLTDEDAVFRKRLTEDPAHFWHPRTGNSRSTSTLKIRLLAFYWPKSKSSGHPCPCAYRENI